MHGIIHFDTFLMTGIFLNLTPGSDTIFVLSRSMAGGKKIGIISALGIGTGSLVHTTLAAVGLSFIITQSITLFNIVKYSGAVYLIYIGARIFLDSSRLNFDKNHTPGKSNPGKIYRDAVFTNVLNPKVAMFFIAFLPQFIDPALKHTILPFFILGITFTVTGTIWCSILAIFSSAIFFSLRKNQRFSSYLNKVCGIILIGLGIKVAGTN